MSHFNMDFNLINHFTPNIPLFIALQNYINSISIQRPMKQIRNDVFSFIQRLGPEGQKFAITALIESIQQIQSKDKVNSSYKSSLLTQLIKQYSTYDNFYSYFPEIVAKLGKQNKLSQYVTSLLNNLKLPLNIQIAITLSLYLSDRNQLITYGQNQLINKIKQYTNSDKPPKLSQKLLDELMFQININPQLSNKLESESRILLEIAEKNYKNSEVRIYNYFKRQWQYFANETPVIEKPIPISIRKSDILKDLGPSVSLQIQNLKAVALQIGQFNQEDIFQCLMMMAEEKSRFDSGIDRFVIDLLCASSNNTNKKNSKAEQLKKVFRNDISHKKINVSWNIDNFLQYCTQSNQNIKWQNVISCFDKENLFFSSDEHFVEMMRIFQKIKKLIKKWVLTDSILFKKWVHTESQAQFLLHLFSCKDSQCLFFIENQTKKNQNNIKQQNSNTLKQLWGYPQLVTLLFEVAYNQRQRMNEIFQNHTSKLPDLLIKTLSEIKPARGQQLVNQIFSKILPQFLQNDPKCIKVLEAVWKNNQQLLIKTINNMYKNSIHNRASALNLDKLAQIFTLIEGSLDQIIMNTESNMSLQIILIAGKKQFANLQKWIIEKIDQNQDKACKQIHHYLQHNLLKPLRTPSHQMDHKETILQQANLTAQTLNKLFAIIIQKLKQDHPSSKNNQLFKKVHKQCCKLFPQVAEGQIYEEVQRQCEQQIKKIYQGQITIKDMIQNLKKLKNSVKKQQRQIYASKITFLCIQLVYHHSYPEKQLMITADLFSSLINQNLVQKKLFQVFLHIVENYLKQDNQQCAFAMKIMQSIKQKIAHQSWFCEKLIQYDILVRKEPQLVESIIKSVSPPIVLSVQNQRKLKQAVRIKNAVLQGASRHIIVQSENHHFQPIHVKHEPVEYDILLTLDKSKKIQFVQKQNKIRLINTICNTVSAQNVDEKGKQLKKAMDTEKSILLLAYNIIFKRIAVSNVNNIQLIFKLIQNIPRAQKPILKITYRILQKWFDLQGKSANNDKKLTNFKNLGSWLGRLTLGKGIPIPIYKLNLKQILIKTFLAKQRISFNVPVVLKIMEFITYHPQIFRQQSPWLKRIMCTLNQLQNNLKQQSQIKAEIKAFFKLSKMNIQILLDNQSSLLNCEKKLSINQVIYKTNLSEQLIKFCQFLQIKNTRAMIIRVLDLSIQQITPQVMKSGSIAKITAMSLIAKDFGTQSNSEKYRQSSITLTKELAKPLALVTCKQPLKISISKHIKQYIKESNDKSKIKDQQLDQLIQKILAETLDLCCEIIKLKASNEAQYRLKDEKFSRDIEKRVQAKRTGSAFRDQACLANIPNIIPMELRPSPNGLTEQQYSIYNQIKKPKVRIQSQRQYQQQQNQQSILNLIQRKQGIQKIRKSLRDQDISQESLQKIFVCLTNENNVQSETQYYMRIILETKQLVPTQISWRIFKQVVDLKKNSFHRKILKKLAKQKYFDQSVLAQLTIQEEKLISLFQKWMQISPKMSIQVLNPPQNINNPLDNQTISNFIVQLPKQLNQIQSSLSIFIYTCLKYIISKIFEEWSQGATQFTQSYNVNYIVHFQFLIVCYLLYIDNPQLTNKSNENKKSLDSCVEEILQAIVESIMRLSPKYSTNHQRIFFRMITNLIEIISYEKQKDKQDKQVKQSKKKSNQPPKQQQKVVRIERETRIQFSRQKIEIFHQNLAKSLLKINPNIMTQFCFAWLQIICNKYVIKSLLVNSKNWQFYYNFLHNLFKFMNENITQQKLKNEKYGEAYQVFCQAVLKLLIIILHDFPAFLLQFSFQLSLIVDTRFMQLKNLIISIYPIDQLYIPSNFEKREDLEQFVQKIGYPKYRNISFNKKKLSYFITTDPNDQKFKQKLAQQDDLSLQILVLYIGWLQQNGLTQAQAINKLTDIIGCSKQDMKIKLINFSLNLIRYPNHITMFFIDFVYHILLKQHKYKSLRQLMMVNILTRMDVEGPISWGLGYMYKNVVQMKIA